MLEKFKIPIAIVLVGLFCFLGWRFALYIGDQYKVHPEKIYEKAFVVPIEKIDDLSGSGSISDRHDMWIHFRYTEKDDLKEKDKFEEAPLDCEQARRWFAERRPEDSSLVFQENQYMKLYKKVDQYTTGMERAWLLHNWRTNDYYYRTWGY